MTKGNGIEENKTANLEVLKKLAEKSYKRGGQFDFGDVLKFLSYRSSCLINNKVGKTETGTVP